MHRKGSVSLSFIRNKVFLSAIIGNCLDHYDTALYGFLVPFIAPLFFPQHDSIIALIYAYSLMSASILTRPLGSLFFGKLSGEQGGKRAFILSLWGVALTTGAMGILPSYDTIGVLAPLGLVLLRAGQGFFSAGEATTAPLLVIRNAPIMIQGQTNGVYQSSTVAGILLASLAAALVALTHKPEFYWRLPFLLSFLTGLVGLYLRYHDNKNTYDVKPAILNKIKVFPTLNMHKINLLRIIAVSSLSYVTYAIPFVFMNAFITQVTSLPLSKVMSFNTLLLAVDMCLLPFFGKLADVLGIRKQMILMASLLAVTAIPLFLLIPTGSMLSIGLIRLWIVVCGLGFSAPLHAWFNQNFRGQEAYLLTGVGYAIGSELFGRSTPAIGLWLWYLTNWPAAPAFYIIVICAFALYSLKTNKLQ